MKLVDNIKAFQKQLRSDARKANRFYLLLFTLLALVNYLLYCYHVEKNPFDIFPPLPVFDSRETITVFVPEVDGKTLLEETRMISRNNDSKEFAKTLVSLVVKGSRYENTRISVPIDCFVRNVWFYADECIIDIQLEALKKETPLIAGSELSFRKAIQKTLTQNIDGISKVTIVERGLYKRKLWEVSSNTTQAN